MAGPQLAIPPALRVEKQLETMFENSKLVQTWRKFTAFVDLLDRLATEKPLFEDKARAAIEGMNLGTVEAENVVRWEKVFQQLLRNMPLSSRPVEDLESLFAISRDQVATLTMAYQKIRNDLAAVASQSSRYKDFMLHMGEPRDFQVWLEDRFPVDWKNKPESESFTDFAKRMMGNK